MNENLPPVCHFIFKEKKHVIFISENIIVNYYSLKLSRLNWPNFKINWLNTSILIWVSLVAQMVKNLPAVQETQEMQVQTLGWEDPLEKGMTTHSSILAWRIPKTEEPSGLYSPWGSRELDMTERLAIIETKYNIPLYSSWIISIAFLKIWTHLTLKVVCPLARGLLLPLYKWLSPIIL